MLISITILEIYMYNEIILKIITFTLGIKYICSIFLLYSVPNFSIFSHLVINFS